MNCCGQKRKSWREWSPETTRTKIQELPIVQNPTVLFHLGETSLVIKGAVTNITYLFGGRGTFLQVDERDLPSLIATQLFAISPADA